MSGANHQFVGFNFETMSGVFPGTRTQVYQRVRIEAAGGAGQSWAQILWYDDPPACVVLRAIAGESRGEAAPLLTVAEPLARSLNERLQESLGQIGWRLRACGSCANWQASPSRNSDGIEMGACTLRHSAGEAAAPVEAPEALRAQSSLALECDVWEPAAQRAATGSASPLAVEPLPRIAVLTESKLKPWRRWVRRLRRALAKPADPATLAAQVVERSGVGAGTEPCLACQGRIANLGALTVESLEGDKQTFSVWRCRQCATLYLSDWIDRWERADSLETEESLYRIAPVEAAELLALFASVPAGDHPQGRQQRHVQRDWILRRLEKRAPVIHIVKQGR